MSDRGEDVHVDDRGSRGVAPYILNLGYYVEMGGKLHSPAVLLPGKYDKHMLSRETKIVATDDVK